jgi:hypothetical protein
VLAGLLTHGGPLAVLGVAPSREVIKELAEFTWILAVSIDILAAGPRAPSATTETVLVE